MEKVKNLIAAGAGIPDAIKVALAIPVTVFCERHELNYQDTITAIQGGKRASAKMLAALIAELEGTEDEWRELLWLAGKPESASA
jgi:hypothetical protein